VHRLVKSQTSYAPCLELGARHLPPARRRL